MSPPLSAMYLPAEQEAQKEEPSMELYLPESHTTQVVDDAAPVEDENVPATQEEQAENSTPVAESVRYFPAAHSVQEADAAEE